MELQGPKYRVVYDWIVDSMNDGSLKLGVRLSSENELSQRLQLGRQTIRHAIDLLEQRKLVARVRGSGTYAGGEGRLGRQERYMNIAVISTYADGYVLPTVLREIESVLSQKGYTTQVVLTDNRTGREQEILGNPADKDMIDGPTVESAKGALPNPNLRYYRELVNRYIPILFSNCTYPGPGSSFVAMGDVSVGRKTVGYLVKTGHRKTDDTFECDDGQRLLRYKGFTQEMEEVDLGARDRNVVQIDFEDMVEMEHRLDYLFCRIGDCTVVVCCNDEVAYILFGICEKRGISTPDRFSLVSIDNSELSTLAEVPIASLPYPIEELGRKVAENIVKMIENPCFDGNYRFNPDVVGRDFVKFIKGGDAKQ